MSATAADRSRHIYENNGLRGALGWGRGHFTPEQPGSWAAGPRAAAQAAEGLCVPPQGADTRGPSVDPLPLPGKPTLPKAGPSWLMGTAGPSLTSQQGGSCGLSLWQQGTERDR